jgi:hypothetical protein
MAQLTFYSSVRRGAALAITRPEFSPASGNPAEDRRARLSVSLDFGNNRTAGTTVELVGPGDIVGLDTRAIVRSFPRTDENQAEGDFLAYVEFDQIDLPWRYTPAMVAGVADPTNPTDRIRPWLFLLVLVEGVDFLESDFRPPQGVEKLPQLTINEPGLLPKPDELWAWAHVQGHAPMTEQQMEQSLSDRQGPLVARLLSPRKLEDTTAYRAFLVPTFQRGVLAGKGIDPGDTDALAEAWTANATAPVTLPVYHSWRFQTGVVSSFDEAAKQLRPNGNLPSNIGLRELDVAEPGLDLPRATPDDEALSIGGALQRVTAPDDPTIAPGFIDALAELVDTGIVPSAGGVRTVSPPLYGRWYAAENRLDRSTTPVTNPEWFHTLNSDPRYRVGAALGTEVVQRDQQALMAAAWEQVERVQEVNRARRVMQAGRGAFTSLLFRHLNRGPQSTILSSLGLVLGRVMSCTPGSTLTLSGRLDESPISGRFSAPWRRHFPGSAETLINRINNGGFIRVPETPDGMNTPAGVLGGGVPGDVPDDTAGKIPAGMTADERLFTGVIIFWVARKLLATEGGRYWWLLRKLLRLGLDLIQLASTQGATQLILAEKLRAGTLTPDDITSAPAAPGFIALAADPDFSNSATWPTPRVSTSTGSLTEANAFRDAAAALVGYISGALGPAPVLKKANIPSMVSCLLTALNPATSFVNFEISRHEVMKTLAWQATDKLEPILIAPEVGRPMWQALRDISPEWILPNVGDVPQNSVSLLRTNQAFIEAFMTGLNHEMTRELLWNGYPTDQRGTYFRQFWDFRGWVQGMNQDDRDEIDFADIRPIAEWARPKELGQNKPEPPRDQLVLLVRGDVIRRYPNVVVYAALASGPGALDDTKHRYPAFQGILTGDVAYYGFDLDADFSEASVKGNPGWYFVLQEHPSEPRFKQSIAPTPERPNAELVDFVIGSGAPPAVAAQLAQRAYDPPLRVAFHGRDLLPNST